LRVRKQYQYEGAVLLNESDDTDDINEIIAPEIDPPPENKCKIRLKLSGPHSPLETKLCSAVRASGQKSITIENESINSILLDTDPQVSRNLTLIRISRQFLKESSATLCLPEGTEDYQTITIIL
jgi:hypothetical protein